MIDRSQTFQCDVCKKEETFEPDESQDLPSGWFQLRDETRDLELCGDGCLFNLVMNMNCDRHSLPGEKEA